MDDLPQRLAAGLAARPADRGDWRSIAPKMAYGRHLGPAPGDARRAAVAILWLQRPDGSWCLPLTLRPLTLRHHGGQICFPGGMIEAGETPIEAALREFQEELGHAPESPTLLGQLDPIYVYASNNLVFPSIFTAPAPTDRWRPDPAEVAAVIEMPLQTILEESFVSRQTRSRQITRDLKAIAEFRFESAAYRLGKHLIWGATAMLIRQIAALLEDPPSEHGAPINAGHRSSCEPPARCQAVSSTIRRPKSP